MLTFIFLVKALLMADARDITGYFWLGIRNSLGKIFFYARDKYMKIEILKVFKKSLN